MAEIIRMPRMSDTMTEGVIQSWQKKEGDEIKSGDILAEVETDKATMELESYWDGVLLHIGIPAGQAAQVDDVIAVIGKKGEDWQALLKGQPAAAAPAPPASAPAASAQQATAPNATPQPAAAPQAYAPVAPAPAQVQPTAPVQIEAPAPQANGTAEDTRLKASPLAKKIAQEKGVDLHNLQGSGDSGRIVRRDIEGFVSQAPQQAQVQAPQTSPPQQAGDFDDVMVSQMRKTIARRLSESMFTAPHFYLTIEINMKNAMSMRKRLNEILPDKVSFNDIVIKAAAAALRRHPKVNASWLNDRIRFYKYVNIGVAIAVEDGLVVPVIRNADGKGTSEIAREVKEYAGRANAKKLQPADFEGNTFTISNLGMFGIEEFTAIINPPDACILAVGAIKECPIVENGEIKIGHVMKVTLSCDHRVVDGATGAQFLQTLKQYLEEPVTILA